MVVMLLCHLMTQWYTVIHSDTHYTMTQWGDTGAGVLINTDAMGPTPVMMIMVVMLVMVMMVVVVVLMVMTMFDQFFAFLNLCQ